MESPEYLHPPISVWWVKVGISIAHRGRIDPRARWFLAPTYSADVPIGGRRMGSEEHATRLTYRPGDMRIDPMGSEILQLPPRASRVVMG